MRLKSQLWDLKVKNYDVLNHNFEIKVEIDYEIFFVSIIIDKSVIFVSLCGGNELP